MSELREPKWTTSQRFRRALFFSLMAGFILNLGLSAFHCEQRGAVRVIKQLEEGYRHKTIENERRNPYTLGLLRWISGQGAWILRGLKYSKKAIPSIGQQFAPSARLGHKNLFHRIKHHFRNALLITWLTLKMILAMVLSIAISSLLFVFVSLIGVMDGLLSRYIRTIEAGRESTFIFHKISNTFLRLPPILLFVYLVFPDVDEGSELFIVLMSLSFFYFFYMLMANLKKFL